MTELDPLTLLFIDPGASDDPAPGLRAACATSARSRARPASTVT